MDPSYPSAVYFVLAILILIWLIVSFLMPFYVFLIHRKIEKINDTLICFHNDFKKVANNVLKGNIEVNVKTNPNYTSENARDY